MKRASKKRKYDVQMQTTSQCKHRDTPKEGICGDIYVKVFMQGKRRLRTVCLMNGHPRKSVKFTVPDKLRKAVKERGEG